MSLSVENYTHVFDHRIGFGQRPALLVIDFVKAYTDPDSPLYAPMVVEAIQASRPLLELARSVGVPVLFSRVLYNDNFRDGGLFVQKIPALRSMRSDHPWSEIVDELAVQPEDTLIIKQYASVFFGTSLASTLVSLGVDTLILAGCSTSGCVRATAVDGMQYGFRVIVPRECVGDRSTLPHEANLFDINAKYGDVLSLGEVCEQISLISARSSKYEAPGAY